MSTIDIRNLNLPQVGVQTDDTTVATSTPSTVVGTPQPTIQNPFAVGYVAQSTSVDLPNGTSLNLPNLTQEDLQQVSTLFGGMSPTQLDNVNQASQRLAKALFAAVAGNSAASTSSSTVSAKGGSGASAVATAGTGTTSQTNSLSAAQAASQRVDSLTSSFYQTMGQTQMNVQPEDGDNDDSDDDDSDDDSNSWGTTGSIPQMQNVQDTSSLAALQQLQPSAQTAVSTSSVAASGQNKTVATAASATANLQLNTLAKPQSAISMSSVGAAGVAATSTATVVANVGANRLADTTAGSGALSTIIQSAASTGVSSTQNKLLSSSSASQAPVVSTGTPEVYSAAANAVNVYQQSTAGTATSSGSLNYDGSVNAVTYMGIIGLQNQLGQYAQQTQDQLNQLNQARTEYQDVTTAVSNWPAGQQTQSFTWTTYNNGQPTTQTANLTYDQAVGLQSNLEDQVNGMSDTNQTQQLQLQSLTQDYQQAINTMSNLLKMDFDTVKAVINNIRA